MIEGLRLWRDLPSRREAALETVSHEGWRVEQVVSGVGVVGFVFEGRPNVFADATGVLRSGNTAVMRIGSDALGTARAIDSLALRPALRAAGLPEGAVALIDNPQRAAGWALFANPGLALAVARGSGAAVAQLGAVARQAGTPVSLHGTGGAWIVADATADAGALAQAVYHSLDSKKCNTLNTLCVVQARAAELIPVVLEALRRRGEQLGHGHKLHVTDTARPYVPAALFAQQVPVLRAGGETSEALAQPAGEEALGTEWEWEGTPEVTLHVVPDVEAAVGPLQSPQPPLRGLPGLGGSGSPASASSGPWTPPSWGTALRAGWTGSSPCAGRSWDSPAGSSGASSPGRGSSPGTASTRCACGRCRTTRTSTPSQGGERGPAAAPEGAGADGSRRCSRIRAVAPQMRSSPQGK